VPDNTSSIGVAKEIIRRDGVQGFFKGFSACFYGSIVCGFVYFSLYKLFKNISRERWADKYNFSLLVFGSSFLAEAITLIFYYPYDMIKCRL
jgi:hypothetical protein